MSLGYYISLVFPSANLAGCSEHQNGSGDAPLRSKLRLHPVSRPEAVLPIMGDVRRAVPRNPSSHSQCFDNKRLNPASKHQYQLDIGRDWAVGARQSILEWTSEGTMMKYRRRVPRQPAGWKGICKVEEESGEWRECRVLDISMLGLGTTFEHPSPSTLIGRRISIYVPTVDDSVSLRLRGRIANAEHTADGAVRVGVEFERFLVSRTRTSPLSARVLSATSMGATVGASADQGAM